MVVNQAFYSGKGISLELAGFQRSRYDALYRARRTPPSPALKNAAKVAIGNVLGVTRGERVLIVTNPGMLSVGISLGRAVKRYGGFPRIVVQPAKTPIEDMETSVVKAIESKPPVIILLLDDKLGLDRKRFENPIADGGKSYDSYFAYLFATGQIRTFFSIRITPDIFESLASIDAHKLRQDAARVKELFDAAYQVRVTTPLGTDITFGIKGRTASVDDGNFTARGSGGNVPFGEAYICPVPGTSNGIIVIDGSIPIPFSKTSLLIKTPIFARVKDGKVAEIWGGDEAKTLKDAIARAIEHSRQESDRLIREGKRTREYAQALIANAYNIGELGVGLGEQAEICGNTAVDEKVFGTGHMALGRDYEGESPTFMHLDAVFRAPTFTFYFEDGTQKTLRFAGHQIIIE